MSDFAGVKQDDHKRLGEAATMYRNLTGHDLTGVVSSIPVEQPEQSKEEQQAKAQRQLDARASAQQQLEEADKRARKIRRAHERGEDVQDQNPGPGQPAMVTERAKAQGVSRRGEEPERTGQYS